VQEEVYLLVLLKYVEANPLRARIVKDCILYKYSSAYNRVNNIPSLFTDTLPILLPTAWHSFINEKTSKTDLDSIRNSIDRQAPLGEGTWQSFVAKKYSLETRLNPIGKPKNRD